MKRVLSSVMVLALTFSSVQSFAGQEPSQTVIELQNQLAAQKAELAQFQEELHKARTARTGWIALTVATGLVSAITSLPGVVTTYQGIKNVAQGVPWLGDPDNGGPLFIPLIVVGTAVSAATGYGAYKSYQKIQLRASDIKELLSKIDAKKGEIEQAENLLRTVR